MFNYRTLTDGEEERVRVSLLRMKNSDETTEYLKALEGALNLAESIADRAINLDGYRDAMQFYREISADRRKRMPLIIQKIISSEII